MNAYNQYSTDRLERRGFISKESILERVSQEEIFKVVFNFLPEEYSYVTSPLRQDKTPGCWFSYHTNGVLYFIDFGHSRTHSDCFNLVQDYYKFSNFYVTLQYIYDTLIAGKESIMVVKTKIETSKVIKPKVKILIEARPFSVNDCVFWSQYEISKASLIEDRVFPVRKFYALNTKKGNVVADCFDIAYSYNDFKEGRKKIYFPKREGRGRFLTNCTKDDVGGLNSLVPYGKELIITKSYKDYRVLKNNGKNVVWFQNEGMMPSEEILNPLIKSFVNITVWFDNDQPGLVASEKIKQYINSFVPGKAKNLWLPEKALEVGIKDPSDCIAKDKKLFHSFLKSFTL